MALNDFALSLPMLLYRALDAVMPPFRRIFNAYGITEQQWRVLRVLVEEPEAAMTQLSTWTLIPAPSLVGVVDRLESAGLVARRRAARDRRVVRIVATASGRSLQRELMPLVAEAYAALLKGLPPREWARLIASLERIAESESPAS